MSEMNRRQLLAALAALPTVPSIEVARLQPGDTIVISTPHRLPDSTIVGLTEQVKAVWPGHRVVVLCEGLTLKVLRKEGTTT